MLKYSVGQLLGSQTREGMRVTPGPHGLEIQIYCKKDSDFSKVLTQGGAFQLIFIDASPFCWFVLNTGNAGFLDCCWSVSRVPSHTQSMMSGGFGTMKEKTSKEPNIEQVPAILLLADISGVVFSIQTVPLANSYWNLLAETILRHPHALAEKEIAKQQARLERRYEHLEDFRKANIKWIKNINWTQVVENEKYIL